MKLAVIVFSLLLVTTATLFAEQLKSEKRISPIEKRLQKRKGAR